MTGVEADGTLVGFYVLHPDRRDNSCWWLGWFALDRRYQGRGYGRKAMTQIMANVRHIVGCRRVRLLVFPAKVHATRLYAQAGFHQVGVHTSGELILEVGSPPNGRRPGPSLGRGHNFARSTYFDRPPGRPVSAA
jgi:RimJ/RimL family protein N-acetyltransferase